MRVLLACPPDSLLSPSAPRHPPHVTAIVAAAVRSAGHDVRLIDHHLGSPDLERVAADVRAACPDAVLVTIVDDNRHIEEGVLDRYIRAVRDAAPSAAIAGAGRLRDPLGLDLLQKLSTLDVVIAGEPDQAAPSWLGTVARGEPPEQVPGVAWRDPSGQARMTPSGRPSVLTAPVPAWDLVDLDAYPYSPHQQTRTRVFPVLASRGCPFPCFFCETGNQPLWVARTPSDVLDEIVALHERWGTSSVFFADANLAVDRGWTLELCEELERRSPPGFVWSAQVRPDGVDAELLDAMARAGCWNVIMGVESLDSSVLRATGKNLDPSTVRPAVRAARQAGIEVILSAMIGLPGDDPRGFRRTLRGLVEADPDYAQFFVVRLRGERPPHGGGFVGAWEGGDARNFQGRTWAGAGFRDEAQLLALQREAYLRFYLRGRYVRRRIARVLMSDHPLSDLQRNVKGAALAVKLVLGRGD